MKRAPMSLAQLCMWFHGQSMHIHCGGVRADYYADWVSDYVFRLPDRVKNIKLVHASKRPMDHQYSYYLGFGDDADEQFFFFEDTNCNSVFSMLCDMLMSFAGLIRRDRLKENGDDFENDILSDCFEVDSTQIFDPCAITEIIARCYGKETVIARFDSAIDIPFDCVEQRKTDTSGEEFSWGHNEDEFTSTTHSDAPLSEIYARFCYPEKNADSQDEHTPDPIELPLRVDGTIFPILLYDYVLILGLNEKPEKPGKKGRRKDTFDL